MVTYINRSKGSDICDACDREGECYWFRPLNLYLCVKCLKRELKHRGVVDSVDIFKEKMEMTNNQDREIIIEDYFNGRHVVLRVKNVPNVPSNQKVSEEQITKWIQDGIRVIRHPAPEWQVF